MKNQQVSHVATRHGEEGEGLTMPPDPSQFPDNVRFCKPRMCWKFYISLGFNFTFLYSISTLCCSNAVMIWLDSGTKTLGKVSNVLSKISGGFILTNVEKAVSNSGLCRLSRLSSHHCPSTCKHGSNMKCHVLQKC